MKIKKIISLFLTSCLLISSCFSGVTAVENAHAATTVPATVTSSDVPTAVSELMTGNVSSVIDNFTFRIVEGEVGGYEKHSFKN